MGKLLITLALLFSTSAWAAEIYDFSQNSQNNHASAASAQTPAARSPAPASTVKHRAAETVDDDPQPPPREVPPGSVVGSDAVAHAHDCNSAAGCDDSH